MTDSPDSNKPRHKSFGFNGTKAGGKRKRRPPVSFQLVTGGAKINCRTGLNGLALFDFAEGAAELQAFTEATKAGNAEQVDPATMVKALGMFRSLLQQSVLPSDWDTFAAEVAANEIGIDDLASIAEWLMETYTARPTE